MNKINTPFKMNDLVDDNEFTKDTFDKYMLLKAKRDNAMKNRESLKTKFKTDAVNQPGWDELDKVSKEMQGNPFGKNLDKYNEFYNQFYNNKAIKAK